MNFKIVDISEVRSYPLPLDLTPEQESAIIAQYKADRTSEAVEADYQDIEKHVAESIPADHLLRDLQELAEGPPAE